MKKKILIIDDDLDMCALLSRFLEKKGYQTEVAYNGNKGLAKFNEEYFDIVLCDFRLGDKEGKDILVKIKETRPKTIVIIITGYSDIKIAVDVIKLGAFDYITKPLIPDEVINVIEKALKAPQREQIGVISEIDPVGTSTSSNTSTVVKPKKSYVVSPNDKEYLVGQDGETSKLYKQIEIVAQTNYSIILYGESGTGKEVIAKTIHESSKRKGKPFIAMDCGTLSKELAGSEL
ncbi:MAG: response regulator, partial [Ginsengibacter sp.]